MPRFITGLRNVNRSGEDILVLLTVEVRWFHKGKIPARVRSWFRNLTGKSEAQPLRVDHYLLEHDTDALGIKFREGRIEVKQRQGEPELVSFGSGWKGHVECWSKWGFPLADASRYDKALGSFDHWIAVQKKRRVVTYALSSKGKLIALPGNAGVACACSVELAQVRVEDSLWWSLGFEARGRSADLAGTLERVARCVLDDPVPLTIDAVDSFGYPRWLQVWSNHAGASK